MIRSSRSFIEADGIENFNYKEKKKNVEQLFSKYRSFKMKEEIIEKRYKSALSLDNLGIFSSTTSDPVGNKVEQLEKYTNFTDLIDNIYKLNKSDLSKDEILIYKKYLISRVRDEDLLDYLNINSNSALFNRKRSCIIKVAMWFDLEVYN